MARDPATLSTSFDEILAWLNDDRETAAALYIQLRHDLTTIFRWNRCSDPEGLTDEVFDRVARKVHHLQQSFEGDPRFYFYGVARNLIKENLRKVKSHVVLRSAEPAVNPNVPAETDPGNTALLAECLHSCLQQLSKEKRELIVAYYAKSKRARIEHRVELARRLGISVETLRVKAYRIRSTLEECIARCLKG